jgi:hypothetical protein
VSVTLIVVLTLVVLAVVVGLGVLIVRLQRRAQTVVPDVADREAARGDRVVAVDESGRDITESEDAPAGPGRDAAGFERVLSESLEELHPDAPHDERDA